MTPLTQPVRSAAILLAAIALGGCGLPFPTPYGNQQQYAYQTPSYSGAGGGFGGGTGGDAPGCTAAVIASPTGELSSDLVATWQDWAGGTDKITVFAADGSVTIAAFPLDARYASDAGSDQTTTAWVPVDQTKAPVVEAQGQYTVTKTTVTIQWDDGQTEVLDGSLDAVPGCTMLTLTTREGQSSRIPGVGDGELERVTCIQAQETTAQVK